MNIKTCSLNTERKWRAATGLRKDQFYFLLEKFIYFYIKKYGTCLKERNMSSGIKYSIESEEELLLFVPEGIKSGMSFGMLGTACGMDSSRAKRNQSTGMEILVDVLTDLGCIPKRKFVSAEDLNETIGYSKKIIIDASEQRTNRPKDLADQKNRYSGKKKPYFESNDYL